MTSAVSGRSLSLFFGAPLVSAGPGGPNLLENAGFETAGTGTVTPTGTDVFDAWIEFDAGYELDDPDDEEEEETLITGGFPGYLTGTDEVDGTGIVKTHDAFAEGSVPKSVIFTRDPFDKRSGTYCCKMYSNRGGNVLGAVWQGITVDPASSYVLTIYSKTENGTSIEQGRVRVYDASNERDIIPLTNTGISSDEWTQTTFHFSTEHNTTRVFIMLYQNIHQGSSVFWDDLSLRKKNARPVQGTYQIDGPMSYSHTSTASGGFDTMTATFPIPLRDAPLWMEEFLFKRVVAHDGVATAWEGFVDQISLIVGEVQFTIGPAKAVVNRGQIVFREMDYNTNPPTGGGTIITHFVDVEESQLNYGVMEGVITGGSGEYTEMIELLGTIMEQISLPDIVQGASIGSGADVSVTVTCAGMHYLLEKYTYNNTGEAGMIDASEKVIRVLRRDPNRVFAINKSLISPNDTEVKAYENESKTARTVIADIVALGDLADNRYHWGGYENGIFVYEPVSGASPQYSQSVTDGIIKDMTGAEIPLWMVRPGKWLLIGDLLPGRPVDTARFRDDPRLLFIESISFSTPNSLTLTSGKGTTFRQQLDRLGLGGI